MFLKPKRPGEQQQGGMRAPAGPVPRAGLLSAGKPGVGGAGLSRHQPLPANSLSQGVHGIRKPGGRAPTRRHTLTGQAPWLGRFYSQQSLDSLLLLQDSFVLRTPAEMSAYTLVAHRC